jgi:hypothetical protein
MGRAGALQRGGRLRRQPGGVGASGPAWRREGSRTATNGPCAVCRGATRWTRQLPGPAGVPDRLEDFREARVESGRSRATQGRAVWGVPRRRLREHPRPHQDPVGRLSRHARATGLRPRSRSRSRGARHARPAPRDPTRRATALTPVAPPGFDVMRPAADARRATGVDVDPPPREDRHMDDPAEPIDPREAARIRRRDHDLDAERRALMRPGMGKVFKQITDSIGRDAARDERRPRRMPRRDG